MKQYGPAIRESPLSLRTSSRGSRYGAAVSELLKVSEATKSWHGVSVDQPDWSDHSHAVALGGVLEVEGIQFHLILNAFWAPLTFELPGPPGEGWRRWIDTSLEAPDDIVGWEEAPPSPGSNYVVASRSVVMLYRNVNG